MSEDVMQMMAGRNDPCPCGSGRKYKKCCLSKHEEEQQLRSRLEQPETLSDKYFSVKEYISEAGFPLNHLDFLLLEMLNITGGILQKYKKLNPEKSREVLINLMIEIRNFFVGCRKCKLGCLKNPYGEARLQSLMYNNLETDDFPEVLQRPLSVNLFYFELIAGIIETLSRELEPLLPKEIVEDIISTAFITIIDYVADNCWGNCNHKCVIKHKKNAYCSFCIFGTTALPCPRSGDVSYKEIHATEKDMMH